MNPRWRLLRIEVEEDWQAFERIAAEMQAIDLTIPNPGRALLSQVALGLHNAYGSVESLLSRVARHFEGELPAGESWHKNLLDQMRIDLPPIRPAILSPATATHLRDLLSFRHFIRHAYAVDLDTIRLKGNQEKLGVLLPILREDIQRLSKLIARLESDA